MTVDLQSVALQYTVVCTWESKAIAARQAVLAMLQCRKNRIESARQNSNQGAVDEETDSGFQT